jgi:hypothetical protein
MVNGIMVDDEHQNLMTLSTCHVGVIDFKIRKYQFGVASNGIMSIPNVIKICPAILKLLYGRTCSLDH